MKTLLRLAVFSFVTPILIAFTACSSNESETTGPVGTPAVDAGDEADGGKGGGGSRDGGTDAPTSADAGAASSTGIVTGSVDGFSLVVAETTMLHAFFPPGGSTNSSVANLIVSIDDYVGFCDRYNAAHDKPSSTSLSLRISLRDPYGRTFDFGPGKFPIADNFDINDSIVGSAAAVFHKGDASCGEQVTPEQRNAASGTIEIEVFDTTHVKGRFDLLFGTDHVSGTFDSPACDVPAEPPTVICVP